SSGETIYYTTDGSEPDTSSEKYTEPILLQEGETTVMAISVNKREIPSLTVSKVYTINIPVADAPAVTPSTGQYDAATQITINVPEGYTAYYTLDGSEPSDTSAKYEGPIDMPEGQTMFSAVLVSKQGKYTQVTKRNYVLEPAG
ncbi:MAG TPA: endoglucanase, partial [Lachnospiraceae bacterium]|nr:endoglucanase [Lachnospiraceae bacterium]